MMDDIYRDAFGTVDALEPSNILIQVVIVRPQTRPVFRLRMNIIALRMLLLDFGLR